MEAIVFKETNAHILKHPNDAQIKRLRAQGLIVLLNPNRESVQGLKSFYWKPNVNSNFVEPMTQDEMIVRDMLIFQTAALNNKALVRKKEYKRHKILKVRDRNIRLFFFSIGCLLLAGILVFYKGLHL